eukprot:CAMPEP_0178962484 /NCGR_PEP_ID=MMETSP0789-20121207/14392_1 /TAXON_ID=3005 /ORGANISM="Rhizosolenia setigera, Strain CCMP 1694" /LENGTH=847 /DNA_ID=CAMNT_0020646643 /DNA_START=1280 /DNA_END=3823 /DNA_ORIENTATION=+
MKRRGISSRLYSGSSSSNSGGGGGSRNSASIEPSPSLASAPTNNSTTTATLIITTTSTSSRTKNNRNRSRRRSPLYNDIIQQSAANNRRRTKISSKRSAESKKPRVSPTIDSDLLRFLSEQRKAQAQQAQTTVAINQTTLPTSEEISIPNLPSQSTRDTLGQKQRIAMSVISSGDSSSAVNTNNVDIKNVGGENELSTVESSPAAQDSEIGDKSSSPLLTTQSEVTESSSDDSITEQVMDDDDDAFMREQNNLQSEQWMNQYHAEKVASILIENGAHSLDAYVAGVAVQNYATTRFRRRQINRFLRNRDELWATYKLINATTTASMSTASETTTTNTEGTVISDMQQEQEQEEMNNVEEVISLMLEFGMTPADCVAIFIHTPSIALMQPRRSVSAPSINGETMTDDESSDDTGMTLEETLETTLVTVLIKTLKLRKYDARKIIRNCPGLLTMRGSQNAKEVIQLLSKLGASPSSLAREKSFLNSVLRKSPASIFRFVAFLSSENIRMKVKSTGPFLRKSDSQELFNVLCPPHAKTEADGDSYYASSDSSIEEDGTDTTTATSSETSRNILAISNTHQTKSRMRIQSDSIDRQYQKANEIAEALHSQLGIRNVEAVIKKYPSVLLLDLKKDIFPISDFLFFQIGMEASDIPKVLESYPAMFGASLQTMETNLRYLSDELEVTDDSLPKIFRAFPAILTLDKDKDMVPVVKFLEEIGVSNIGRFVTRLPALLGYSVENELKPKWTFLTSYLGLDSFEIVKFPGYFAYPMERIQTRFRYLRQEKGIPTRLFSVDHVLRFGDADFCMSVAGDTSVNEFHKFVNEYKKSNKQLKKQKGQQRKNNSINHKKKI